MELVEDDEPHVIQPRIGLQTADEEAFGQDLDAGRSTHLPLEAHGIADLLPRLLAEQVPPSAAPPGVWRAGAAPA